MSEIKVDFNRPVIVGNEFEYMKQAIENRHISGDGPFTKKCHAFFEKELGVQKALLTPSCTHALEMSAILLEFQPGDEVIIPDFTFVSTVNAFVLRGAKPVFLDVRRRSHFKNKSNCSCTLRRCGLRDGFDYGHRRAPQPRCGRRQRTRTVR
jgi:dTDP-4-amino-4,6-dideoxygalactose transaminase